MDNITVVCFDDEAVKAYTNTDVSSDVLLTAYFVANDGILYKVRYYHDGSKVAFALRASDE